MNDAELLVGSSGLVPSFSLLARPMLLAILRMRHTS